jgi:hypothetical protein
LHDELLQKEFKTLQVKSNNPSENNRIGMTERYMQERHR